MAPRPLWMMTGEVIRKALGTRASDRPTALRVARRSALGRLCRHQRRPRNLGQRVQRRKRAQPRREEKYGRRRTDEVARETRRTRDVEDESDRLEGRSPAD